MRDLKFLITGMIGLSVNLGVYQALFIFDVPYLVGSIAAFLVAMIAGFILQKYWTFEDRSLERMYSQFTLYAVLAFGNLAINTFVVYRLVERGIHHLIAQAIGAGLVTFTSYFVYRRYIFPKGL